MALKQEMMQDTEMQS